MTAASSVTLTFEEPEPRAPDPPSRGQLEPGVEKPSDEHIIAFVQGVLVAEDAARNPRELRWRDGVALLQNDHDFSEKALWQSRLVISKVPNALSSATAILKQGITQTRDWFDLELRGTDPADEELLGDLKTLLRAELEERDSKHRDFLDRWFESLKYALATSPLVMKFTIEETTETVRVLRVRAPEMPEDPGEQLALRTLQDQGMNPVELAARSNRNGDVPIETALEDRPIVRIHKDPVDPFDYYRDHTGRGMYELQKIRGDLDELERFPIEAGYRPRVLEEVKEGLTCAVPLEESEQGERTNEPAQAVDKRLVWKGIEFWGDIPAVDGRLAYRRHVATLIEDRLVRLAPFPDDDGSAFRFSEVETLPFSEYGRGMVENVAGLARALIELSNAALDAVQYDVLRAFELDVDMVQNPSELSGGIRPGKVFSKKDEAGGGKPMLMPLQTGQLSPSVPAVFAQLERWFQEGTSVTELVQGLSPSRGFPTAREIQARQTGSNIVFRSMAQQLEKQSLEPCICAIFNRMIQFKIFGAGGRIWCEEVLGAERARTFYAKVLARLVAGDGTFRLNAEIRVAAITNILARSAELERLTGLLAAMRGFPGLVNRLKMDEVAKRVIHVFGYDAESIVKTRQELEQVQQLEMQALQQAATQTGQQPRSNAGMGAASMGAIAPSGT